MALDHPTVVQKLCAIDILPTHHVWTHVTREWALNSYHWSFMAQPYDFPERLLEGKGENWLEEAVATRPFGRLLSPQDVAYVAAYFASDESACITGSVMDMEQYPVGAPPNW